jgi:hypothetical protein
MNFFIFSLFDEGFNNSNTKLSNDKMIDELERVWKEVVIA